MKYDQEVVERILHGDREEFDLLIGRFKQHVFKIAAKYIPADTVGEVAHEVFVRVYRSLRSFKGDAPLEHWISKVTVRACYDYWRGERRREREITLDHTDLDIIDRGRAISAFSDESRRAESKRILAWALDQLRAEDRMVVTLLHLEDHSEKETADLLGWSVSKVKGRAFRARRTLEEALRNLERKEAV